MDVRDRLRRARLLLVTDPRPDLEVRVEAAVRGGVDIVQLREKRASREEALPLARRLRELCVRHGALFTVNDDIELARLSGAHGVHLGQEDEPVARAREVLGAGAVVGRSAGSLEEARRAVREGADYLGVGSVYPTPTKPDAKVRGLGLVRELARADLGVPWFAIGGVTLETAEEVAAAGAPGFAVVRAVLDAGDPEAAARVLRALVSG
ncbi:Thiamine-phosphate synthase [Rubrobacter xylanophilus DSM 9941]|uniref:thiamine phosphate synthase n=1 Tax=Rubrobacter xylanophilus TaxID=49319 RepID=UPI001C644C55|nr:thiamine phosphate synthase [Rubrobacter xylanophilus]QYJ15827.1 Thiamine-phosphate synthase [Rubrobacter xylanophilus DSM 9941]